MTTAQFSQESVAESIQEFITESTNVQSEVSFGQSVVKITQSTDASYASFHKPPKPENVDEWTIDELYDELSEDYDIADE